MQAILEQAVRGDVRLGLTTVNAGEVLYAVERALGASAAHAALRQLQAWPIDIASVDLELASRAAWLKLTTGLGYADSFVAALAHRDGATILTGDSDFRRVESIVPVAWLGGMSEG